MCRGREAAEAAAETARQTFALGGAGDDLPTLQVPEGEIGIIAANVQLGFASSNKQARQKVLEGAIRINGEKITDPHYIIVIGDEPVKLSFGAKRHALQIGRASCRERVCQYVSISVVAVSLKKKLSKIVQNITS